MPHNLEMINGTASFVSVKQPAWHGLGTIVEEAMNQEEVIKRARLDYNIQLNEVKVGEHVAEGFYGIQREDTGKVFGFVTDKYKPIQNTEAFSFFDSFIDKTDGIYQTAGVLFDGMAAWVLAKLPDYCTIRDSQIDLYVTYVMWHDGKTSNQIGLTPTRIVCWNTLCAAMRNMQSKVNIRHFENYEDRQRAAVETIGIKNNYFSEVKKVFEEMAKAKVTTRQADEFFAKIVTGSPKIQGVELSTRSANKIAMMIDYYKNHDTQKEIYGTAFGLYNAVTGYYQNVKDYKTPEKRFNNIFIGGDAQKESEQAFHYAMMMV